MTLEQQRETVANALGWKRGQTFESSFVSPSTDIARDCWLQPNGQVWHQRRLPDFSEDANCRGEMLESLDQWQLSELITNLQCGSCYYDIYTAMTCLSVTQPTFTAAWLKVKGLWMEGVRSE